MTSKLSEIKERVQGRGALTTVEERDLLALAEELERERDAANAALDYEREGSICDKLDRARKTRRLWQSRAEAAESELTALRSELQRLKGQK